MQLILQLPCGKMVKHILSVSGGKDSTALLLWAIERGIDFQPVFADTGNENSNGNGLARMAEVYVGKC